VTDHSKSPGNGNVAAMFADTAVLRTSRRPARAVLSIARFVGRGPREQRAQLVELVAAARPVERDVVEECMDLGVVHRGDEGLGERARRGGGSGEVVLQAGPVLVVEVEDGPAQLVLRVEREEQEGEALARRGIGWRLGRHANVPRS